MTHPTDTHVGQRLRSRRVAMGLTQTDVAEGLGISFQQVQKYELGRNRISASKLLDIARMLNCPVAYFFAGLEAETPDPMTPGNEDEANALLLFRQTPRPAREAILNVLKHTAEVAA